MLEYVGVLVLAMLGMAVALAGFGAALVRYFRTIDLLIGLPFP